MMGATKRIDDRIITKKHKAIPRCCSNKKRNISIPFLPDELIFRILIRLSADILFNTVRYVCKQWYNIIKDPLFIREQMIAHSRYVDLCFHCHYEETVYFARFGREKATLFKLMTLPFPKPIVLTICDGLILFRCETLDKIYVANPLTKQLVTLPPVNPSSRSVNYWLGRAGSLSLEYKVMHTYYDVGVSESMTICGMITLGKDESWRYLDIPHVFPGCVSIISYWPVLCGKFIYWTSASCRGLLTFDVESESFRISSVPDTYFINDKCRYRFLVRGGYVTYMIGRHGNTLWEVWTLSHNTTGDWKKLFVIDFRPQKQPRPLIITKLFRKGGVFPVAWMDDDVLVFRDRLSPYSFVSHNIKTGYSYLLRSRQNHRHSYGIYTPYAPTLVSIT